MPDAPGILYCNCTYAQIIDPAVKAAVLRQLCDSGRSFEAVADLCEMSARKDPALQRLACGQGVKIAACYPRAVKWLFASAGAPLDVARTEVLNMRELTAAQAAERLLADDVQANLPAGKTAEDGGQRTENSAPTGATSAETPASA
jgi:hypothetical protein